VTADREPEGGFAPLAPELDVTDLDASLRFWCGILGFRISYARPEDGFAYLEREGAQVMLCRRNGNWETASLEHPFGRGLNLQIAVAALDPVIDRLRAAGWPLFREAHAARYRVGESFVSLRQILVQDPDGYLLRFAERRPPQP
jgi:catechol 2,3-dioxygenase-like lactoylglutathione lyase family enzyme